MCIREFITSDNEEADEVLKVIENRAKGAVF
jgi:hypothetical protein